MSTKGFVLLLFGVLLFGGVIGGAFVVGITFGKNQEGESIQTNFAALQPATQSDEPSLNQLRQQIQSGGLSQEEVAQFRQQFRSQGGLSAGRQGFSGGGLIGTIEKIEGNTITVNTSQGLLPATVVTDTTIQMFSEGKLSDLAPGLRVTVTGQRQDNGSVEARSIIVVPEGAGGLSVGSGAPWGGIREGGP